MPNLQESSVPLATELLVATFTPQQKAAFRNEAWQKLLGNGDDVWADLSVEDREMAVRYTQEAAAGTLVTNQVFLVKLENRDQPLPILLHFIPVAHVIEDTVSSMHCVTIAGEVLMEPESWVLSQTQRNRIENVGRMTLGLVHEINNMLTNILGNFEIIEKSGLLPVLDSPLGSYLGTIKKAAHDGAAMTRSIKKYIRNEKTSDFELLDIPSLLQDCITFTRPYWYIEPRRKGVEIESIIKLAPVPKVFGSAVELKQVFINLITNAVQAMPRGGRLTFKTYADDQHVVVLISDTGNGMSEKTKKESLIPCLQPKENKALEWGYLFAIASFKIMAPKWS